MIPLKFFESVFNVWVQVSRRVISLATEMTLTRSVNIQSNEIFWKYFSKKSFFTEQARIRYTVGSLFTYHPKSIVVIGSVHVERLHMILAKSRGKNTTSNPVCCGSSKLIAK